ncbi:Uncharacterized membrane protein YidH, DUF202 family [Mycolicibacterium rutilum]|uniref:Uncharacterized membrane protein YidH, DUF202 family n=1 Tax=Mycolicibacterium rutilum TaxID=370526 RepID=A0A1H6J4D3_MYCRU|nr:DUF202 domain-containing protein [Mycolicibacterium rutilum]SEH53764.1 Uncharacterized membrane protein YidH, DUF202 family [Mycolicibacterium rutilum]
MPRREPTKPGLAAERTLLSWERSSFGFLVGGALILLRQHGPLGHARTLLAAIAVVLALVVLALGYRRSRRIRTAAVDPRREVLLLGGATVSFAFAVVTVLLFTG